jgi:hypothetical protein
MTLSRPIVVHGHRRKIIFSLGDHIDTEDDRILPVFVNYLYFCRF